MPPVVASSIRRVGALVLAVAVLTACGASDSSDGPTGELKADLEQIKSENGPVYWLGPSFEGLRLAHAEGSQPPSNPGPTRTAPGAAAPPPTFERGPFFVYGECNGQGSGAFHCTGPQVQLQHWPIASPSRYPDNFSCTRTTIRGVPAAQFDGFEIYIGRVLVRIYAPNQAQARRVAAGLRPLAGSASARDPLPQPAIDVSGALRRCALDSLDAKLAELERQAQVPLFWLGRGFEGLPLFRAEGDGASARFMYGGCKRPEVAGSCYPALTVEVTPLAEHRPADWRAVRTGAMRCDRLGIRGAEAVFLPYAQELYVFTGPVVVVLRGPDHPLLRRAADRLRGFDAPAGQERLPAPPDELRVELRRVCGA